METYIIDVLTVVIALYGAILSTYIFYTSRALVTISILKDMKSVNTGTILDYIKIANKSKESICIQSIWIKLYGEEENKFYLLTIDSNKMIIDGLRSQLYPSEKGFNLDKIMTISVCTDHDITYSKHYKNIFLRMYDKILANLRSKS